MTQTLDGPVPHASLQYVTTDDGYRIAYSVSGEGEPLLCTPCLLQSDILRRDEGTADFLAALADRFRVIRYDGRGTGNSTRGVGPETTILDTLRDLMAVVQALKLDRFILYGDVFSSYILLRAAAQLGDALKAVVMVNPVPFDGGPFLPRWEPIYTHSWEEFTNIFVHTYGGPGTSGKDLRERVDHEDFVRLARSARGYHLKDALAGVSTPTLVLCNRDPVDPRRSAAASEIASTIPNSRLALFDGHTNRDFLSAPGGALPPAIPVIDDFLATIPSNQPSVQDRTSGLTRGNGRDGGLSSRELEVFRLLAAGKSNPQIAETLVISPHTVAKHVTGILTKTGTANRVEAALYAREHGLA